MVVASVMLGETPSIAYQLRQSSKRVENAQLSNHVLSIKHPFMKSITERIDNLKVTLQFNRPVYSDSINALPKYFDYGVDTTKMKEWFFTLAYPGVPLTDSYFMCSLYATLYIQCIYRYYAVVTQDCGVYVAAFAKYLLDGLEIYNHLDAIDTIRIWYGVLLWDYAKKKQRQCTVSEDESAGRLLKKNDGMQQI
ncbi:hypothetical protein FXO37_18746 [Capsicum annuum]|nr:hypothetical protein FXO37_18746 [Capsicum annuum]